MGWDFASKNCSTILVLFFVILLKLVKVIPVSVEWEGAAELWVALMLREESFPGKSALKGKLITQMYIQNIKLLNF